MDVWWLGASLHQCNKLIAQIDKSHAGLVSSQTALKEAAVKSECRIDVVYFEGHMVEADHVWLLFVGVDDLTWVCIVHLACPTARASPYLFQCHKIYTPACFSRDQWYSVCILLRACLMQIQSETRKAPNQPWIKI
jgi:hypothetical protein